MPEWAEDDPREFWKNADKYERANGRLFRAYEVSLPNELKLDDQIELVQEMAKEALIWGHNEILKRNKDANATNLNGAITVTNPITGDILAMVGGVNYQQSNFNRATQSTRQTGSSFKPFIFQLGLDSGLSPASQVPDIPKTFDDGTTVWTPKNYTEKYDGYIPMKIALEKSRNLATVNLMHSLGTKNVVDKLRNIGFRNMPYALSVSLGSYGISPLEYSKFYSMFAGGGVATTPKFIIRAESFAGAQTLFEAEKIQVTKPEQAYLMVDMMKGVVQNGTARSARVNGIEVAGKTGTSNNNIDAWFCGYTPELLVMVWYGNDDYKPMRNVEVGGRSSAPVFKKFMDSYLSVFPNTKRVFDVPEGVYSRVFRGKPELYTKLSPLPYQERFRKEEPDYSLRD